MTPAETLFDDTFLLGADSLLVGEQHDAPAHQQLQRALVQTLAGRGQLAALVLEMAERGASTAGLDPQASEAQVQAALRWREAGWDWAPYAPVLLAAVRAGVPVLGGNLPRSQLGSAMQQHQRTEDLRRAGGSAAVLAQLAAVREGHCHLLPESQMEPMLRVQVARDQALAQTLTEQLAARSRPGQLVLLVAGSAHVDARLGVPLYLGAGLTHKTLQLVADPHIQRSAKEVGDRSGTGFDARWRTAAPPAKDYCAALRKRAN